MEKPTWGQVFSDTINTGIYVLEPEIFDFIPEGRPVDFSGEVFPAVLEAGRPDLRLRGRGVLGGRRDHRGLPARPTRTSWTARSRWRSTGFPLRPGVWLGKGSTVDPTAVVDGPAIIGDNCSIGPAVVLGEYTTLGSNVRIAEGAEVRRSVVNDNGYLGRGGPGGGGGGRAARATCATGARLRAGGGARARAAWSGRRPRSGPA